jgi:glycerol kinase
VFSDCSILFFFWKFSLKQQFIAQHTGIYDPFNEGYGTIASMLSLPLQSMPDVRATNAGFGTTTPALFGAAIPIGAVVGDQQAACFAQRCGRAGAANVIYCIV